MLGPHLSSR